MKTPSKQLLLLVPFAVAALAGCQSMQTSDGAAATLEARSGSKVSGVVSFRASGDKLLVSGSFSGLTPNAEHGFHVHEKGDCSAPDASSAGGHFNPTGTPHGPAGAAHHAGDLPNIRADAAGNASYQVAIEGVDIAGPLGIVGRSVVVHRDRDDYTSQPAGNSGPRIACGVILR
jgi:Cu-Zn family superoxide dismutase